MRIEDYWEDKKNYQNSVVNGILLLPPEIEKLIDSSFDKIKKELEIDGYNRLMKINDKCLEVSMVHIGFTSNENVEFKKKFAFVEKYSKDNVEKILQHYFPPIKKINFIYFEENGIVLNGIDGLNAKPS